MVCSPQKLFTTMTREFFMRCPLCHAENPDASQTCHECAAPLPAASQVPGGWDDSSLAPTVTPPTTPPLGGKYDVAGEIGRGGMGVVYKARDIKLNRWVALKLLPDDVAGDADLRERFVLEAQAAAALSHPNICVVHEVGEDQGRPYIAMEFVEGETLRRRIARAALGTDEVLALFTQIAAGLEYAHSRGIIHRDIKTANIMVTDTGQVKIMDFGLAKLEGGPSLTKTGTTLGTVAYMSPEQAVGDEVDQRTDLWSAGVVLYEMLTGDPPFRGHEEVAVVHAILHENPRPLKDRTPPVPADLQRVLTRALKKRLDARYTSAGEMLEDLRAVSESLRTEKAPLFDLRSLTRRLFRPRVAVPAVVALAILAVVGVRLAKHRAKVRWAKEIALPEIARLIDANDVWRNLVPAYRLAEEAEVVLGDDPGLATLFSRCSLRIDVRTEPPGAHVQMKEYSNPDAAWSSLGVTPLDGVRVPIGIFRWRIEKEGYETVYAAASTWDIGGTDIVAPYNLVRKLDKVGSTPPEMVRVAGAETESGTLDDFFVGRYEVTNREYRAFIDSGGYRMREYWKHPFMKDGRELSWDEAMDLLVDRTGQPGPATWVGGEYSEGQDSYPVSGLSWYEAAAYAEFAGMSLPTTVHWDVARGRLTPMLQWPQLGGFAVLAPFCNFSGKGPVPVGSLPSYTAFGAYDLPGNVREWCWNEAPDGRVVRGGSWGDNSYQFDEERSLPPMDRSPGNGVRLAFYPDANAVSEEAFAFRNLQRPVDLRSRSPVSDAVFEVYREQFAYDPRPLDARVESRVESSAGWVLEKVSFNAAYGDERIPAYLFLPKVVPPPYQTVVYFPGAASSWMPSSADLESYYEFTMFLSFLVRNGRAVLYPVYQGTFERSSPELIALDQNRDSRAYTEFCVQLVKDVRRSIDYLETREDIDGGRLAYYGMSWGAYLASLVTAVENRFRASVLVAGGVDGTGRPEISDCNYVTRVRVPTLILNGRYDSYCPPETCSLTMRDLLGTPAEDKRLILYETDHIPPRTEYIKEILAWLDHYLGPVR